MGVESFDFLHPVMIRSIVRINMHDFMVNVLNIAFHITFGR
jgi:hypothetical protein